MPRTDYSRRRVLGSLGAAVAGSVAGCSGDGDTTTPTDTTTSASDATTTTTTTAPGGDADPDAGSAFTALYRETVEAITFIRTFTPGGVGEGTGWIVDDGHVVTNHHVIADAERVEVRFADGDWRSATIRGTDVYADLAVLSVDDRPDGTKALSFIPGRATIGQEVAALGNPFGLEKSISQGIVSGVNRSILGATGVTIPHGVQTDAAINPGNSGGPLVTLDGEVVGVISAGGGDNIGFAISAPLSRRVVPSLAETGSYTHPFVGVRLLTVSPTVAQANDLPEAEGVLVTDVLEDGPSDGKLRPSTETESVDGYEIPAGGDVIVGFNGRTIQSEQQLTTELVLHTSPGDSVPVDIIREGQRQTLGITLGSRPEPP